MFSEGWSGMCLWHEMALPANSRKKNMRTEPTFQSCRVILLIADGKTMVGPMGHRPPRLHRPSVFDGKPHQACHQISKEDWDCQHGHLTRRTGARGQRAKQAPFRRHGGQPVRSRSEKRFRTHRGPNRPKDRNSVKRRYQPAPPRHHPLSISSSVEVQQDEGDTRNRVSADKRPAAPARRLNHPPEDVRQNNFLFGFRHRCHIYLKCGFYLKRCAVPWLPG